MVFAEDTGGTGDSDGGEIGDGDSSGTEGADGGDEGGASEDSSSDTSGEDDSGDPGDVGDTGDESGDEGTEGETSGEASDDSGAEDDDGGDDSGDSGDDSGQEDDASDEGTDSGDTDEGVEDANTTASYGGEDGGVAAEYSEVYSTAASRPDLVVSDLYYDGPNYIRVEYCNIGDGSSNSDFLIMIRDESTGELFSGNYNYRFSVPAPGDCAKTGGFTCGLIGVTCGERATVSATIDWEERVSESNENNNKMVKTISSSGSEDSGYEETCYGDNCEVGTTCKKDLFMPGSICCREDQCAAGERCIREYQCMSPEKMCYGGDWIDVLDYEVNCFDGIDNDCDGLVDKKDSDCYVCGNGVCEKGETLESCPQDCRTERNIIVRGDDVGPWWSVESAMYVTDYLIDMGIPQTIGVVPITAGGTILLEDDPQLVSYLRGISKAGGVEIGIHGLKHSNNEFEGLSQSEAEEMINEAGRMFEETLFVEPLTFMPPHFAYDENALYAAKNQGILYFSAGWNAIDNGYGFSEYPEGLLNVPATTDFYNWGTGAFYSAKEIEDSCENAMTRFGTCVIIIHHHLFAGADGMDQEKTGLLEEVMEWVKSRESDGVTLKTIGEHGFVDPPEPKMNFIVFRSDDIGPFWAGSNVINVTETLRDNNIPQVLSIIPSNQYGDKLGDDTYISEYLEGIGTDSKIEFALHGYSHESDEFGSISYSEASEKIINGAGIIQDATGVLPASFIPPYNLYNDNTISALEENSFGVISSGYDDIERGLAFKEEGAISHLPATVDFYDWADGSLNTIEEIKEQCEYSMERYNACVFVIHHHTFLDSSGSISPDKLQVLVDVADWAKSLEEDGKAEIVLLKDINVDAL